MSLTAREAHSIARKLDAEVRDGGKHPSVIIKYEGLFVARYGIRHSSYEKGHDYIPRQLHVSRKQAVDLAQCSLGKDAYFAILQKKGLIPRL